MPEVIIEGSTKESKDSEEWKGLIHTNVWELENPAIHSNSEYSVSPQISIAIASGEDGKSKRPEFSAFNHTLRPRQHSIIQETRIKGVAKDCTSLILQVTENSAHLLKADVFVTRQFNTAYYAVKPEPVDFADAIGNEAKANGTPVVHAENRYNGVTVDLSKLDIIAEDSFEIILHFTAILQAPHENQVVVVRNGGDLCGVTPRLFVESGANMRQMHSENDAGSHLYKTLQDIRGSMDGIPAFIPQGTGTATARDIYNKNGEVCFYKSLSRSRSIF